MLVMGCYVCYLFDIVCVRNSVWVRLLSPLLLLILFACVEIVLFCLFVVACLIFGLFCLAGLVCLGFSFCGVDFVS